MKLGVVRRLEKAQRLQSDCLTADVCTSRSIGWVALAAMVGL